MNTELRKVDLQEAIKLWKSEIKREEKIYNSLWDIVDFIKDRNDDDLVEDDAVAMFCTKTLMKYFDDQAVYMNNCLKRSEEELEFLG